VSEAADSDPDLRASGAGDEGSGGTSDGAAGAPAAGVSEDEKRRRDLQSQLDRERAKTARLEAELRAQQTPTDDGDGDGRPDPVAVDRMVAASIARETAKADLARDARERYPNADPQLLADLSRYRSAEELEVTLARSHEQRSNDVRTLTEQVEQEVRARLGQTVTAPDGGGQPPAAGDELTVAGVKGMGLEELLDPANDDRIAALSRRLPHD
jgi:hypothetical protein